MIVVQVTLIKIITKLLSISVTTMQAVFLKVRTKFNGTVHGPWTIKVGYPVTPVYTARVHARPVSTTRVDGPS